MNAITKPIGQAASWFADNVLGIDNSPDTFTLSADQAGAAGQPAPAPAAPQMALAPTVPEPITPQAAPTPSITNIINPPPPPPAPPAFGSAPSGGKPTNRRGTTFLGQSAQPQRRAAAAGFGFDKQSSGSKTLIGQA